MVGGWLGSHPRDALTLAMLVTAVVRQPRNNDDNDEQPLPYEGGDEDPNVQHSRPHEEGEDGRERDNIAQPAIDSYQTGNHVAVSDTATSNTPGRPTPDQASPSQNRKRKARDDDPDRDEPGRSKKQRTRDDRDAATDQTDTIDHQAPQSSTGPSTATGTLTPHGTPKRSARIAKLKEYEVKARMRG